uniref:Uncharacterized protein LOC102802765 n=1 Tax=Saccoglossus kowalevskii TaxID=10224 RepID=A0ABM0MXD8_SACKO
GGEPEALPAFAATTPSLPDEDEDLMDFEPAVEVEGAPECYDEMPAENRCGIKPKGLSIRLECEKGQYVYIQSASYGRSQGDVGCDVLTPLEADECTSETTLQAVKDKCEGRRSCVVPFRPNFHGGNPCGRRVETFLNVKYVCAKSCGGEPEALPAFAATTPSLQDEDEDLMDFEPAVEVEGAPECYDEMPAENRCGIKPKGLSIRLECEKGQYVYIQSASYGRSKGDVGCDVLTPLEADECTSETTCKQLKTTFAATTPSLPDEDEDLMDFEPAVEVVGAPECYDEMPAENRCGIKPKGLSIRLECEKGQYVYIQSASYGRSQGDVGCDVLTPLEADECTSETTLQAVKDKCEGRRSCVVPFRPNFHGGNPCGRRVETFLNVKYVCAKSCGGEPEALPAFAATTPSLPDEDEDLMDFEPAVEVEGAPECYDEMPAENRCGIKPKGLSIRLECEKGQYVYIQSASYGRSQGDVGCDVLTPLEADECTSETTLQAVKDKCEGRRSCVVPFRPNFHGGNPCGRRVETFLNVKYVCAKSCGGEPEALPAFAATTPSLQDEDEDLMDFEPAVEVVGAPECYDEMPAENRCGIKPKGLSIRLECEKGQYVYIQSASYGRSQGDVGCDVLTPLEADECTSETTLQAVKEKCEGRRSCVVPFRPNFHGGNPCGRRVETFLNVKYVCAKSCKLLLSSNNYSFIVILGYLHMKGTRKSTVALKYYNISFSCGK